MLDIPVQPAILNSPLSILKFPKLHDSLYIIGRPIISREYLRRRFERTVAMTDERGDSDQAVFDQSERTTISRRPPVPLKSSRCSNRTHQRRLQELDIVHHAQIYT